MPQRTVFPIVLKILSANEEVVLRFEFICPIEPSIVLNAFCPVVPMELNSFCKEPKERPPKSFCNPLISNIPVLEFRFLFNAF